MKKIFQFLVLGTLLLTMNTAQAQDWRLGLQFGPTIPLTKGSGSIKTKGGLCFAIDIEKAIEPNLAIGLEANLGVGAVVSTTVKNEVSVGAGSAYLLKGRYFFTGTTIDGFFASIGLGVGKAAYAVGDGTNNLTISTSPNFAFQPELGYRYKFISFGVKYLNIGGKVKEDLGSGVSLSYSIPRFQDLQFTLGLNLGWGNKN